MFIGCPHLIAMTLLAASSTQPPSAFQPPLLSFANLSAMSWHELEAVYRGATPGELPSGFVRGRTIYNPCEPLACARTRVANRLWKGKHFCPENGSLINQFAGVRAIRGDIYPGESWLDGKPAHILDYADTSIAWRNARDEMRQVAPGLWVGAMYIRECPTPRLKTLFILEACSPCSNPAPAAVPVVP